MAGVLQKFCKHLEHLCAQRIPSKWLHSIKKAITVTSGNASIGGCSFGAGLASSVDYAAPAHVDDDFFVSFHQINVEGCFWNSEIAQYFCFPSCGFAVGLCPGHVLLFNPQVHHSLFKKSDNYLNDRVHVSTLYIKTAHVSKNDTSLPLTTEEQEYYSINF